MIAKIVSLIFIISFILGPASCMGEYPRIVQRAELYLQEKEGGEARHIEHWPDYVKICLEKFGHVIGYDERTFLMKNEFTEGKAIAEWPEKEEKSKIHLMFRVRPIHFSYIPPERLASCEVNLIHNYGLDGASSWTEWLDDALACGVWALCDLKYYTHGAFYNKTEAEQEALWATGYVQSQITAIIDEVRGHPALYGYYIYDDMNLSEWLRIGYELQLQIYNFIRSLDSEHPIFGAIAGGPGGLGYESINMDAVDVLVPNTYSPGLGWACQQLRLYFDENPQVTEPLIVFGVNACYENGNPWEGLISSFIALVDHYGLSTGGYGMWEWGYDIHSAHENDVCRDEIAEAWGPSNWDPPSK